MPCEKGYVEHSTARMHMFGAALCCAGIAIDFAVIAGKVKPGSTMDDMKALYTGWYAAGALTLLYGVFAMCAGAYKGGPNEDNKEASCAMKAGGCQNGFPGWAYGCATGWIIAVGINMILVGVGFNNIHSAATCTANCTTIQCITNCVKTQQEFMDMYGMPAVCSMICGIFLCGSALLWIVYSLKWKGQDWNTMGMSWGVKNCQIIAGSLMAGAQFFVFYVVLNDFKNGKENDSDVSTNYYLVMAGFIGQFIGWACKGGAFLEDQAKAEQDNVGAL